MIELLKQVPNEVYAGLFGAFMGGAFTLVGVWLNNRGAVRLLREQLEYQTLDRRRDIRRERLEELYTLVEKWADIVVAYYIPYISVMKGELTYNQALDIVNEKGGDARKDPDTHRLSALAEIYFPEATAEYMEVMAAQKAASNIKSEHKSEYKAGNTDGIDFARSMLAELGRLDRAAKVFKKRLLEIETTV